MKMRKVVSAMLVAAMATGMVAGCGSSSDSKSDKKDAKGKVYYLNFKPEQDEQWQDLAKEYTKETGVDVTVLTAASGEYEKTLKSEMAKSNAPTLFQVNGPVGLASWKDYCYDLKDSDVAKQLTSDDFALMDGDKMSGIAYVIESYGIIYNKELLKKAGYSADDITNFDSFKKVVEDITKNKDKLGFSAFTSAGMDGSSDWRFKTHLANLPIYYEYKDEGIDNTDAIKGTYLDNYRQIWDLYINNATCKPTELSTKTADDATADPEANMKFSDVNETVTAKESVNLRDIPSQGNDSTIKVTLNNGDTATRTGVSDSGWSRVEYNGQTYYAISNYLTTDMNYVVPGQDGSGSGDGLKTKFKECNDTVTAKIEVNLRALPSVTNPDATVVATIKNGETVTRTGINEEFGWSRVEYNGQTLYCVTSYLSVQ